MNTNDHKAAGSDELDLFGVAEFIFLGWKTILAMTVIGGIVGICVAVILPEKFQASVAIDGGRVVTKEVESTAVLAERMRSPSFYSTKTQVACQDKTTSDPARAVVQMLGPNVPRESIFVNISAKMKSRDAARSCLLAVLEDVQSNQRIMFEALEASSKREFDQLQLELVRNEQVKSEEVNLYQNQLEAAQRELMEVESFLQNFQFSKDRLDINDEKFSASSLLVSIISEKESEALDLKDKILEMESRIRSKSGLPETERAIADLKLRSALLGEQLQYPVTREAEFVTPVFSPVVKVEPRRSLIVASGTLVGGFVGILFLLLGRFVAELKKRRAVARSV